MAYCRFDRGARRAKNPDADLLLEGHAGVVAASTVAESPRPQR
jgi:hypothetical protein